MMRLLTTIFALVLALPAAALDLSGRVVSADGKPLADAYLYVFQALPKVGLNTVCPSCYRDCGKREKVAADGSFRLRNLDGKLKFRLLAVADGYEPQFSEYVADGPVALKLTPRRTEDLERLVRGKVVDPHGKPVVGAIVESQGVRMENRVGYGAIPGVDRLSISNEKGEFALRVPDASAKLDVRVRARNFAPTIARYLEPCAEGQTVRINVGATIAGRVVRKGKPQPGVRIAFDHRDRRSSNFLGRETIGTDEKGGFVMTGLGPSEEYYVLLDDDSRTPPSQRGKLVKLGADGTSVELGEIELE